MMSCQLCESHLAQRSCFPLADAKAATPYLPHVLADALCCRACACVHILAFRHLLCGPFLRGQGVLSDSAEFPFLNRAQVFDGE